MREILFKAKRISNGEWVEGYYTYYPLGFDYPKGDRKHCIRDTKTEPGKLYFIDENTLCQYTGLTDKNGNKIWENDIVEESSGGYVGFVEYMGAEYSIEWNGQPYIRHDILFWVQNRELEAVGNIFDNPELLEGVD